MAIRMLPIPRTDDARELEEWRRRIKEMFEIDEAILWDAVDKTGSLISDIENHSHTLLTDIGTYTHTQIDSHIDDTTIHFTQASITTVGTITSGVWQGTAIGDTYITKTGDWTGTFDGQEGSSYALLAGRATPQTLAFGNAASAATGYLTSTSHATKGKYFLNSAGTITIDELNVRMGIGTATPSYIFHALGADNQLAYFETAAVDGRIGFGFKNDAQLWTFKLTGANQDALVFKDETVENTILTIYPSAGNATAIIGLNYGFDSTFTDAATNTVTDVMNISHKTSGTAAAGLGTGLLFSTERAAGVTSSSGRIANVWTDVTAGSLDSDMEFYLREANTLGKKMVLKNTGELQLIQDNYGVTLGAGLDAKIYYDGTNLIIDPNIVGSGGVLLQTTDKLLLRDSAISINSTDDGHLDLTADISIDLNGDVVITGETAGVRQNFNAGDAAISSSSRYLKGAHNGAVMTATNGWRATRAGSIVGISAQMTCSNVGTAGTISVESRINGTTALAVSVTPSVADIGNQATQARNTAGSTFLAGDILTAYIALGGTANPTVDEVFTIVEFVYNS